MNTVFILSSGILSFGALFFIHQLTLSKRLQRFANLRMRILKKDEDREHNKTTGTFLFHMEATDRRLCKVVIAAIRFPGTKLQVHIADQPTIVVKDLYEPLPVCAVGFSCDRDKLERISDRQCAVEVEGYMFLEKEQQVPFIYKVNMRLQPALQSNAMEVMA
ncbi:hypothetical protein FAZ15_13325 [Sphingobacterium olei]|uniref:Uncharacterized protein n=1 Tax=Sphingobacterium olei TaxID=2571155 RepID=A0A4U0P053_9SPHI|nr:hypothetical protein [Sphingobacterium olei]TJZ59872.1 hypothetical protein FAZ15_13325 [Sphingobacterium olei]